MRKNSAILLLILLFLAIQSLAFAQKVGEIERAERQIPKEEALREKIEKPKKGPEVKEEQPQKTPVPESTQKVMVKKVTVTGVTLIPAPEIQKITTPYENKELLLKDMQKVADLITDLYRQRGYITSRAYLPPQKIEQGVLEVRIIEGAMGDIDIKGNRYFKTKLIRSKITLKKGQPFNYNTLRKNLVKVNENADRAAKAVLAPGKTAGSTDVVLEVKDRLPIHLGFNWDNFGSRFIRTQRYSVQFTHNNLLGLDDKLSFQYQMAQAGRYMLKNVRYLLPVLGDGELGAYAALSRVKLGKEYEDLDARGKSQFYGIFFNKPLIDKENFDLTWNLGFDYKNIVNYQEQAVTSHDKLRVVKTGFEMDASDKWGGRNLLNYTVDFGIPDIMGGLKTDDYNSSRSGAGGKYIKHTIDFLRLQKMPFSSNLLWKNQIQLSPYILTAAEQFQIGGIVNVRGYPPAEVVGDQGYSMTWEWSLPVYGLSKNIKVPFSKAKLYDALRIVTFYDWANTRLRRPTPGSEEKNKTLRGAGCGMRFNLPEDFSVRVEVAWPLDNTPSDGRHVHTWAQVSKNF